MKAYIFACNNETMSECFTRKLFGVTRPYVTDIAPGDFCYLYNFSERRLYGVWKATSKCDRHEPGAWGGRFTFQARVELFSRTVISIPINRIRPVINLGDQVTWKLWGVKAHDLFEHFASDYADAVTLGVELKRYEEDFRKRYPKKFSCEDGHAVRSLSEQTVDNWLYHHKVIHSIEPIVPIPEQLIPDFMVESRNREPVFIEFWGMIDDPIYKERMNKKFKIYAEHRLSLIELTIEDLQNLDFSLSQKLRQKNIEFI